MIGRPRAEVEAELAAYDRGRKRAPRVELTVDRDGYPINVHDASGYGRGCRCPTCTEGQRVARRKYREREKQSA
jgi:hypothetical protein